MFVLNIVKNFMCKFTILKQNMLLCIYNPKLLLETVLSFRENVLFDAGLIVGIRHTLLTDMSYFVDMSQWTNLFSMHVSYRMMTLFCVYMMDGVVKDFK